jgi:hypothetical protein
VDIDFGIATMHVGIAGDHKITFTTRGSLDAYVFMYSMKTSECRPFNRLNDALLLNKLMTICTTRMLDLGERVELVAGEGQYCVRRRLEREYLVTATR